MPLKGLLDALHHRATHEGIGEAVNGSGWRRNRDRLLLPMVFDAGHQNTQIPAPRRAGWKRLPRPRWMGLHGPPRPSEMTIWPHREAVASLRTVAPGEAAASSRETMLRRCGRPDSNRWCLRKPPGDSRRRGRRRKLSAPPDRRPRKRVWSNRRPWGPGRLPE